MLQAGCTTLKWIKRNKIDYMRSQAYTWKSLYSSGNNSPLPQTQNNTPFFLQKAWFCNNHVLNMKFVSHFGFQKFHKICWDQYTEGSNSKVWLPTLSTSCIYLLVKYILIIDHDAGEIICLVASIHPYVHLSVHLFVCHSKLSLRHMTSPNDIS